MRRFAPVAALLIALLLLLYVIFTEEEPLRLPPSDRTRPKPDGCALTGLVLDEEGQPLAGVSVSARILDAGRAFSVDAGATDKAGRFAARLFPPRGAWEVSAHPESSPPFSADAPVLAEPGGTVEVVLKKPVRMPTKPPEPNVGGEVCDSRGRLLTGIPVVIYDAGKSVLAHILSGDKGRFDACVSGELPMHAGIKGDGFTWTVSRLPTLDVILTKRTQGGPRGLLEVRADLVTWAEDEEILIEIWDSVGLREFSRKGKLSEISWRFSPLDFGAYDVRIRGATVGGLVQGFDFHPKNTVAAVPVDRSARLRGRLARGARVMLFSRSPTWVPLDRRIRQGFGYRPTFRADFEDSESKVTKFDFSGIAAGKYLLRCAAWGVETKKFELELTPGQDLDLGQIKNEEAKGLVSITLDDAGRALRHSYRVILYTHDGVVLRQLVSKGRNQAIFTEVPAGVWFYRAERELSKGHTRNVGRDRRFVLEAGEEKDFVEDCSW